MTDSSGLEHGVDRGAGSLTQSDYGSETDEREVLRHSIELDRAELLDAVDELKTAVQSRFNLRERIAENPIPWLVGGFLLGLWLSRDK